MSGYRVESRWPSWARWRVVQPRPHDERHPFDGSGLAFPTREAAESAKHEMERANAGEYRVTGAHTTRADKP